MSDEHNTASEPKREPACPLCGKPRSERNRPFCSKRCADIDLARWLGGSYAIPAVEVDDEDEDGDSSSPDPAQDRGG